ncbi:hypothetical protein BGX20_007573, partial [Mortierella sp. AD010]
MDAGVIAAFKRRYRRLHWEHALLEDIDNEATGLAEGQAADPKACYDNIFRISQLEAMAFVKEAWHQITATTISNCFQHTGILRTPSALETSDVAASDASEDAEVNQENPGFEDTEELNAGVLDTVDQATNVTFAVGTLQFQAPANEAEESAIDKALSVLIGELRTRTPISIEM